MIGVLRVTRIHRHTKVHTTVRKNTKFENRSQTIIISFLGSNSITMVQIKAFLTYNRRSSVTSVTQHIVGPVTRNTNQVNPLTAITRIKTYERARLVTTRVRPPHTLTRLMNITSISNNVIQVRIDQWNTTILIRRSNSIQVISSKLKRRTNIRKNTNISRLPATIITNKDRFLGNNASFKAKYHSVKRAFSLKHFNAIIHGRRSKYILLTRHRHNHHNTSGHHRQDKNRRHKFTKDNFNNLARNATTR